MATTVRLPAPEAATARPLTVSSMHNEEQAALAALALRAALRTRGVPDSDYHVDTRQHSDRRWIVTVTSDDADAVVLATCLDAMLRRNL
jgi:nucleotide-binding universal stress UspA family protein